jgi:hypothetical protein
MTMMMRYIYLLDRITEFLQTNCSVSLRGWCHGGPIRVGKTIKVQTGESIQAVGAQWSLAYFGWACPLSAARHEGIIIARYTCRMIASRDGFVVRVPLYIAISSTLPF